MKVGIATRPVVWFGCRVLFIGLVCLGVAYTGYRFVATPLYAQQIPRQEQESLALPVQDSDAVPPGVAYPDAAYPDIEPPPLIKPTPEQAPPPRGSLMGQGPSSLPWPDFPNAAPPVLNTPAADINHEPDELLMLTSSMPEAIEAARILSNLSFRIKNRQQLEHLNVVLSVFRLPRGSDARQLQRQAALYLPDATLALNHRYTLQSARHQAGQRLIRFNPDQTACLSNVHVGLLDTSVNLQHPALSERAIEMMPLARPPLASASHATAIASLWLGRPDAGFLPLMPGARLSVAVVFRDTPRGPDTTAALLLAGLDWLLGQQVEAVNLAFGGPENPLLSRALNTLMNHDILLVAAVGNQGPDAAPLYPAAQPDVVAITAVDAQQRIYRDANRGQQIDFAAPGVQIWAASENATAYHSGTSFAVPFALAVMLVEKRLGGSAMENTQAKALDLGPPGKDNTFGWGLVRWPDGCQ